MAIRVSLAIHAALAGEACAVCVGAAQVLASEPGKVAQTIDGTTITVEYFRPIARGRQLFGGVVEWGSIWTPGANWATTIEVDRDVRLDNHPLPRGKYSVWMHPRKDADWTVMLSRRIKVWHLWPPPSEDEQLRYDVKWEQGPEMEVLTWSFPSVMRDGAALCMQWGTTVIPLHITVEPSRPVVLTAEERTAYVGTWSMDVNPHGGDTGFASVVEIVDSNGLLRLKGNPIRFRYDPEVDLTPIGGHQFHPYYYQKGQPVGLETGETFIFRMEEGRANLFEIRGPDNKVIARGVRVNVAPLHPPTTLARGIIPVSRNLMFGGRNSRREDAAAPRVSDDTGLVTSERWPPAATVHAVSSSRPSFRTSGHAPATAATTSSVPMPPATTDATGPTSAATAPDSK